MSRLISSIALALVACTLSMPLAAQLVEGRDYKVIDPPHPLGDPDRIMVTEFFSYQCPHCNNFYRPLNEWVRRLPTDVTFERFALSLGYEQWAPMALAFYTLQTMGLLDEKLDAAVFAAIHVQHQRLYDEQSVVDWVGTQGINATRFMNLYDSFAVGMQFERAEQLARADRVASIPTLVLGGKYMVQIQDNGNFAEQLAHVDQLIARLRLEK